MLLKTSQTRRPQQARLRILLVDDYIDGAEMLAELLRTAGHRVFLAHDGAAGLAAFDALEPDLAILDLDLPALDGFALAEWVRTDARFRFTPLIALSSHDAAPDRARTRQVGFDHHIGKPPDLDKLRKLLASYAQWPAPVSAHSHN